jgi:tellurite resistance protein TerC
MGLNSVGSPTFWIGFTAFVAVMLALDLGVFHRKAHSVSVREALGWSIVWVSLAMGFAGLVYYWFGSESALQFLTGYVIEQALSVDNLFVFLVVFSYFKVPDVHQHRVLFWGIIGALVLRAIFILIGAALIQRFHWIFYIFGAFLVFTGFKLLFQKEGHVDPEHNPVLKLVRRYVRMVPEYREGRFSVVEGGRRYGTPLLMVLIVVEATDLVFAVDSIPAIFAVTSDPFIVYTSNIFAILGLRSLYFVLSGMMGKFHYLKVGLGLVLAFVGTKMLIADFYKFPIALSLGIVLGLLVTSIVTSLLFPPAKPPEPATPPESDSALPELPTPLRGSDANKT